MSASHAVLTILLEADATYSWLLPDGTILPVGRYTNHNDVARNYYYDKVGEGIPGGGYQEWAKAQGWTRMVGTGFEAAKLTPKLLRRVQNAYIDAGVREMASPFFVDIGKQGQRDWQSFMVPYREFLDMGKPAELRRYRVESKAKQDKQRRLVEVQAVGLRNAWEIEHDEVQKILFADPEEIEEDEDLYEQYRTLVRDLFPEYVGSHTWEGEEHDPIQDLVHRAYNFGDVEDYTALADYLRGDSQKLADHHARIIGVYGDEFGFPAGIGVFKSVRHGFESRPMALGLHVLRKLEAGQEPDQKDFEAAQDPFEQAKERFGVTTNMDSAFYLLPDGDMLSGGGGTSSRAFDHRQIGYGKGGTEGMQEFMSLGAIRLMPEDGSLDIMVSPTSAQMRVLEDWIEHYNLVDGVSLDLQDGIGEYDERQEFYLKPERTLSKIYEPDENPKRILGAIRRFFGGG